MRIELTYKQAKELKEFLVENLDETITAVRLHSNSANGIGQCIEVETRDAYGRHILEDLTDVSTW